MRKYRTFILLAALILLIACTVFFLRSPDQGLVAVGRDLVSYCGFLAGVTLAYLYRTPHQERRDRDERNRTIQTKAAMTTWWLTLAALFLLKLFFVYQDNEAVEGLVLLILVIHTCGMLASMAFWHIKM